MLAAGAVAVLVTAITYIATGAGDSADEGGDQGAVASEDPVDPQEARVRECQRVAALIASRLSVDDTDGAVGVVGVERPEWRIGVDASVTFATTRVQRGEEAAISATGSFIRAQCEQVP